MFMNVQFIYTVYIDEYVCTNTVTIIRAEVINVLHETK